MREGKKGERSDARRPQSCHEANACVGLFLNFIHTCLAFSHCPLSSLLLAFIFLIPWQFTPSGGWTRLCCMLALPCTFRVHDKGMQSADAQGAYYDGRYPTARICKGNAHFPYEFVQQRRFLKNYLEMKVRSILAGSRSHGL